MNKKICYCGSLKRAKEAFKQAEFECVMAGNVPLMPCCMHVDIEREFGANSEYKVNADKIHMEKIAMADEVVILNVGGYIGESTRKEMEYADSLKKPIFFLEIPGFGPKVDV